MRIGIDIRCLAEGRTTGVEEYTRELLKHLFEADRENDYLLFYNAWKASLADFTWLAAYPNVTLRVFRYPNKLLNFCLWYFRFPKLDRLLGGVDVLFVPNLNFVAVSRAVRLIVTAHDLSFELFPETFNWKRRIWHALVNFRRLLERADAVVAVSQSTALDLVAHYRLPLDKLVVIPSGVSERFRVIDRNDPILLTVQAKYQLPYRFVLSLGTLEPRKNLPALLQAFTALKDEYPGLPHTLVVAGSAGWKESQTVRALEKPTDRRDIHWLGSVDEIDKPALYNLASVFVYPSLYEGFGFPPLEALKCGTPVVTGQGSAFPETVGDAAVLIDAWQPNELKLALLALLQDPALRERLRAVGFRTVQRFDWRKTAESLKQLWK